jgi:hypothetical protein
MKNIILILTFLFSVLLAGGCRKHPDGKIIARVGETTLTFEDALAHIDTSRKPVDDQVKRYIAQWVNDELINQEAARKGIESDQQFQIRVREASRILANQYFLEQYIYSDTTGIDEKLMQDYFRIHREEFIVQEDVIKMNVITFTTREKASLFAASVLRGTLWSNAVNSFLEDTSTGVVSNSSGKYTTQRTLFPSELWKVASTLSVKEVSFPIKTSMGYTVIQALSNIKKGDPAEYSLVQDMVRQRYIIEQRRSRYNELLENLHKRYKVEILYN